MVATMSVPPIPILPMERREGRHIPTAATPGANHIDNKCETSDECISNCADYGRVCPCAARAAARAAQDAIRKIKRHSHIFPETNGDDDDHQCNFVKLNADDLLIQERLGEGGFCYVHACRWMTSGQQEEDKELAIKFLKRRVMVNQRQFEHGAADLVTEAHWLSVLEHPNIIRLHGVTSGSVQTNVASGKECGYFIAVDRLYDTLEKKLERWRAEKEKRGLALLSRVVGDYKEKRRKELVERLEIAMTIADAMEYLHAQNIVLRDLKPDNVGFSKDGTLQLFDFGLAKEMKPDDLEKDGRYRMTGNTGSRRYMAPEVARDLPYNASVDVYSFGILLWELCSGEKPFFGYTSGKHMIQVVVGGERPKMDNAHVHCWPLELQCVMKRCWTPFPASRPTFVDIKQTLAHVLSSLEAAGVPELADVSENSNGEVSPPPGGFGSMLRPKRVKAKSDASSLPQLPPQSPVKTQSRHRSWDWASPTKK